MVAHVNAVYRYRVDAADVMLWVDRWWLAFARENGALDLDGTAVIGRKIWDFIGGEATQNLYREIHQYVRETAHPVTVPFRCDSPTLKRYMQVKISSEAQGRLLYESTLLRVESHRRMRVLESTRERNETCLTMCSCCKRSLLEPSGWLDLQSISLRLRLFKQQTVPELRYTVCPDCRRRVEAQPHHPPSLS